MNPPLYVITYRKSVAKELRKLSPVDRVHIVNRILALAANPWPEGAVSLQGSAGMLRIRQGDYRIIYQVSASELIVLVVKIGHRREVYR